LLPSQDDIEAGEYDLAEARMVLDQIAAIGKQMHDQFGLPVFLASRKMDSRS
jgi:hypothetical protein